MIAQEEEFGENWDRQQRTLQSHDCHSRKTVAMLLCYCIAMIFVSLSSLHVVLWQDLYEDPHIACPPMHRAETNMLCSQLPQLCDFDRTPMLARCAPDVRYHELDVTMGQLLHAVLRICILLYFISQYVRMYIGCTSCRVGIDRARGVRGIRDSRTTSSTRSLS